MWVVKNGVGHSINVELLGGERSFLVGTEELFGFVYNFDLFERNIVVRSQL